MTRTRQIADNLKQRLRKAQPPFLQCIGARLSIQQDENSPSSGPIITIFAEADSQLTKQMLRSAEYTYPQSLLMNNMLAYSWVTRYVQRNELVLDTSELMAAAVVGVAEGTNYYGPRIDTQTATLHVPEAEFPPPVLRGKKHLSGTEIWTAMLTASDRPGAPTYDENDHRPALRVVHVPFSPSIKDRDTRAQVARLTLGWNYRRVSPDPEAFTEMLGDSIADHLQKATSAVVYLNK